MATWFITTFYNPAGYNSRASNYDIFIDGMQKVGANILTVELAFKENAFFLKRSPEVLYLRSNSVLWQKERLINYAISKLPKNCDIIGWLDCDLLFNNPNWIEILQERMKSYDVVQLFEKVLHLPPGCVKNTGECTKIEYGIGWQQEKFENWLPLRRQYKLPYATPGFAWAARADIVRQGLYDRLICGNGDTFFCDCVLDSFGIHHYYKKRTKKMAVDQDSWHKNFRKQFPNLKLGYIPTDVCHLYHGTIENRQYKSRDDILLKHNFDPEKDIILRNYVYEWNSNKKELHQDIESYFRSRKEDT